MTQESALELSLDPSDYLDDESDDDGSASCGSLQLMAVDVPAPHGPVMLLGDRFLRRLFFFCVGNPWKMNISFFWLENWQNFAGYTFVVDGLSSPGEVMAFFSVFSQL